MCKTPSMISSVGVFSTTIFLISSYRDQQLSLIIITIVFFLFVFISRKSSIEQSKCIICFSFPLLQIHSHPPSYCLASYEDVDSYVSVGGQGVPWYPCDNGDSESPQLPRFLVNRSYLSLWAHCWDHGKELVQPVNNSPPFRTLGVRNSTPGGQDVEALSSRRLPNDLFRSTFVPGQEIVVDELLWKFHGQISFKT